MGATDPATVEPQPGPANEVFQLVDWKRRVFDLYAEVRATTDPALAWERWRSTRDELFRRHPQSPLPEPARAAFERLNYFPYDAALRVTAEIAAVQAKAVAIGSSGEEPITFSRFAEAHFSAGGSDCALELYWLEAYGGGLFLPFSDATTGIESYGGGRYLLDTVKGADLGLSGSRLVLDFNFAYNPSCSYDPGWVCPLSPAANRLPIAVRAGECAP